MIIIYLLLYDNLGKRITKHTGVSKGCADLKTQVEKYANSTLLPDLKPAIGQCVSGSKEIDPLPRLHNSMCPGSSTVYREVCLCASDTCNGGHKKGFATTILILFLCLIRVKNLFV